MFAATRRICAATRKTEQPRANHFWLARALGHIASGVGLDISQQRGQKEYVRHPNRPLARARSRCRDLPLRGAVRSSICRLSWIPPLPGEINAGDLGLFRHPAIGENDPVPRRLHSMAGLPQSVPALFQKPWLDGRFAGQPTGLVLRRERPSHHWMRFDRRAPPIGKQQFVPGVTSGGGEHSPSYSVAVLGTAITRDAFPRSSATSGLAKVRITRCTSTGICLRLLGRVLCLWLSKRGKCRAGKT